MQTHATLLGLTLAACGTGPAPETCTVRVEGGDGAALVEAVEALQDGESLCLGSGRFSLGAPLALRGRTHVAIRGAPAADGEPTVLDLSGGASPDPALSITGGSHVELADLTLSEPAGSAVSVVDSDSVTLRRVEVRWERGASEEECPPYARGGDAIHAARSSRVHIEQSRTIGAAGAGVHLDGCRTCLVLESDLSDGRAGVWVESSNEVELRGNVVETNATGVMVVGSSVITLRANLVVDSIGCPFAPPGSFLRFAPVGVGVVLVAARDVEAFDDRYEDHPSAAIVVASLGSLAAAASIPADELPAVEPESEVVYLHDESFVDNAFDPAFVPDDPLLALLSAAGRTDAADLVWDGALRPSSTSETLCFRPAGAATFLDLDARDDFAAPSVDPAPHDCAHPRHGTIAPADP